MTSPSRPPSIAMSVNLLASPFPKELDQTVIPQIFQGIRDLPRDKRTVQDHLYERESTTTQDKKDSFYINVSSEEIPKDEDISDFTPSYYDVSEELNEIDAEKNGKYESLEQVMKDIVCMSKEVESFRDKLHMLSVKNATLLDCLTMAGADI